LSYNKKEEIGNKILENTRTALYLEMPFMGRALGMLSFSANMNTSNIGTDGISILYNPSFLINTYRDAPRILNRIYLHMLMHSLFLHMYIDPADIPVKMGGVNPLIWDIACDIAVEAVIDGMDYQIIWRISSDYRERTYRLLEDKIGILTAQRIYAYLMDNFPSEYDINMMEKEFKYDDHSFWEHARIDKNDAGRSDDIKDKLPDMALERGSKKYEWEDTAKKIRAELERIGSDASKKSGSLSRLMSFEYSDKKSYREFLKRFCILREESGIDLDSFDYGFYNYGMTLYGNMPLIEENEYCESNKIDLLVIAIDTSASCNRGLVEKFLKEVSDILFTEAAFFKKRKIHIIQCDERVHKDVIISSRDDLFKYIDAFEIEGGYGTDFRPVFSYVDELRSKGALKGLKGLIYFTDGFGTYPTRQTTYDTAFVFMKDEPCGDDAAPYWITKLYI